MKRVWKCFAMCLYLGHDYDMFCLSIVFNLHSHLRNCISDVVLYTWTVPSQWNLGAVLSIILTFATSHIPLLKSIQIYYWYILETQLIISNPTGIQYIGMSPVVSPSYFLSSLSVLIFQPSSPDTPEWPCKMQIHNFTVLKSCSFFIILGPFPKVH